MFVTVCTTDHLLSLCWARLIPSAPHSLCFRSILISFSLICQSLQSFLPSAPFLSPIYATCPAHAILLDVITQIMFGEEYKSGSSSVSSLFHSPVILSLLDPDVVLINLFSNILKLYRIQYVENARKHSCTVCSVSTLIYFVQWVTQSIREPFTPLQRRWVTMEFTSHAEQGKSVARKRTIPSETTSSPFTLLASCTLWKGTSIRYKT